MALADLNIRVGVITKTLDSGLASAESKMRKFSRKFSDVGAQLSTTFSAAFGGLAVASVQAFAQTERLEKGLAAVTKSTVPVVEQIARLKALAEAPGLGFEQAVIASTRLQAVGFSAQFAEETIKQVANAVATTGGTADNFDSVLKQFTQMIAKGKILQEDLGIIQENMPAVSGAIEKAFGTNNVEKIRASGVSAQEFVQKVVGELGGLKRVEGGLSNSLENLGISVTSFFSSVGKEINEAFNLQSKIDYLSGLLNDISTWFASLDENVQRNIIRFVAFAAAVGPVLFILGKLATVGQVIATGFRSVIAIFQGLSAAVSFLLSPVGLTIAAVAALAVGGIYLAKNWDSAKATFINVWIAIKNTVLKLINNILKGIDDFTSAATFGVAGTNFAEKFSFKTADYVDVPAWKSFGDTMKEVGGDLLEYAGLAGKAKKQTQDLNKSVFSGDTGPNISGGDAAVQSAAEQELAKLAAERRAFSAEIKANPISPFQNTVSDISGGEGAQAAVGAGGFNIQLADRYAQAIQEVADKHSYLKGQVKSLATEALPQMDVALDSTQQRALNYVNALVELNKGISDVINSTINEMAVGFGEFLGDLATGAATSKEGMGKLLVPIANALESLGKLAISAGLATEAIKTSLQTLGGFGAIAAGIALIALSKIVKSKAASFATPKLARGGLAYGETLAVVGDNPNASSDPEVIAPLSKLKNMGFGGDSGGDSTIQLLLRGEDLFLAMERTKKRMAGRIN